METAAIANAVQTMFTINAENMATGADVNVFETPEYAALEAHACTLHDGLDLIGSNMRSRPWGDVVTIEFAYDDFDDVASVEFSASGKVDVSDC